MLCVLAGCGLVAVVCSLLCVVCFGCLIAVVVLWLCGCVMLFVVVWRWLLLCVVGCCFLVVCWCVACCCCVCDRWLCVVHWLFVGWLLVDGGCVLLFGVVCWLCASCVMFVCLLVGVDWCGLFVVIVVCWLFVDV